ncbi:hypothetical protein EUZ93_01035 [Wolbachia pipientis]|nr:hypothetical protein [Wolbachia pipientis]NEV49097.1 hypothetical protein [Wolbachia pipientis]
MLILLNFLISKKSFIDREKISPFECGFDPLSNNRIPFNINFFIIRLIFLIFDIEIILLIPFIYLILNFSLIIILIIYIFIFILIFRLLIEYREFSLD